MNAAEDPRGYYRILGVDRQVDAETLRHAFRQRAKRYHPDHGGGEADTDMFNLVREAYDCLRDPQLRAAYDAGATSPAPPLRRRSARHRRQGGWTLRRLRRGAGLVAVALAVILFAFWGFAEWAGGPSGARPAEWLAAGAERARPPTAEETPAVRRSGAAAQDPAIARQSFELDGEALDEPALDLLAERLQAAIATVPRRWSWVVEVEAKTAQALDGGSVPGETWEAALERLALTLEGLAARGIDPNRLVGRFAAGPGQAGGLSVRLISGPA